MEARDLVARRGEQAEGVVVAQVLLGGEGELGEVGEGLQIVGMDAGGVELGAVMGHAVVDAMQRPFQPFDLQRGQLVARGGLDRLRQVRLPDLACHRLPSGFSPSPNVAGRRPPSTLATVKRPRCRVAARRF